MTNILQTRLSALALAALLAAIPALAQDAATDAPADAAPAETAEQTEGSDLGLSMGEPVATESEFGQTYIHDVSGDWEIRCIRTPLEADPCALHQVLRDEAGNAVSTIELVNLDRGGQVAAGATIVTPLETLLTGQVTLSVDGGAGRKYPFNFCTERGCVARVGFSQEDVERFKRGNAASLAIVPLVAPDQTVALGLSLTGFTAGFSTITELNALNSAAVEKATAEQQNGNAN
ncbi:invasion associated locus B family protein [Tropicimonas aquimaris]|uniref:Invasion associated locus B family protein n=1 Tax=Tropicimonas aquimaris TaxID=914152 RepID=A0ABW3IQB9_9RHOB